MHIKINMKIHKTSIRVNKGIALFSSVKYRETAFVCDTVFLFTVHFE